MKRRITITAITIFLFLLIIISARNKISQAIYNNKVEKVKKLCGRYFKIKNDPRFESIEYKVIPFIDTLAQNKKNDIFLVEHTIRNQYAYDSILKIHHTLEDLPDFLNASTNLRHKLYYMVTDKIIIEPIDSIVFRDNEIRLNQIALNIIKANSIYKSLSTMSSKFESHKKKIELINYIEDHPSESNIEKLEDMINSEIYSESAINPNRAGNIFLNNLAQTKEDHLIELLSFKNNKRKRVNPYNLTILHFKQDLSEEISRMELQNSNNN